MKPYDLINISINCIKNSAAINVAFKRKSRQKWQASGSSKMLMLKHTAIAIAYRRKKHRSAGAQEGITLFTLILLT